MKVLSYDPNDDLFFVAVTWDEYRQLASKYKIDTGSKDTSVEEVIEIYKYYHEEQEEVDDGRVSYEQYIKNLYGIDDMPNICLIIKRDLSDFAVEQYDHPFHHMWNGYSPWEKIETVSMNDLNDLAALECVEKGRQESDESGFRDYGGKRPDKANTSEENMPEPGEYMIENLLKRSIENMTKRGGAYNLLWSRKDLTSQKLGAFCEYYAKMTLISYGINIYTSEIDDHGIDFVAESRNGFLKFQVKGIRASSQYVFMRKEYFNIEDDAMFLFLILLVDGEHPDIYIIPTSAWRQQSRVFVYHDYEGKKSEPEYGVNISRKNMPELEKYRIENMLSLF